MLPMIEVRIDAAGAGEWVMERAQGYFRPGIDHVFSSHDGDRILGGFALVGYLGASMTVHMAAEDPRWCSRELLWLVFDYAFNCVGCRKLFAPVLSNNHKALELALRAGWTLETVLRDACPDAHMVILSMTKDTCPWLDYTSRKWRRAA